MNEFRNFLLNQTNEYCNKGIKIFPMNYKSKVPMKNFKWKEQSSTNYGEIKKYVEGKNGFNLAMPTGKVNDVFVLDIDKGHNGFETLKKLENKLGSLPDTVTVLTGGGGKHFYFKYPEGVKITGVACLLGDGVDTRTDNNYVVIPPSTHESGVQYRWEKGKSPFDIKKAELPPAWINALVEASNRDIKNNTDIQDDLTISDKIPEGRRNTELHRLACSLVYKCDSEEDLLKIIKGINIVNCIPPLSLEDVRRLVKSAWKSNIKNKKNNNVLSQDNNSVEEAEKLINKIKRRKCGQKFKVFFDGNWEVLDEYTNKLDADKAFMCMLAIETKRNIKFMEYIFRKSKMYSEKYEQSYDNNGMTYTQMLIKNAVTLVTDILPEEKNKMSEMYLEFVLSKINLFHNELEECFAITEDDDHKEVYSLDSSKFKKYISMIVFNEFGRTISNEQLSTLISTLMGISLFNSEEKTIHLRSAIIDNTIYYDLTNNKWQVIKINANGWEIINSECVLFRREKHHMPQVTPVKIGNIDLLWKYINIPDEEKLLFVSCICSMYIANIPRPVLILHGEKGASKTTTSKIIRELVDPSVLGTLNIPNNEEVFAQILSKHYLATFDNLDIISNRVSDMLCRAVTR